MAYGLNLNFRSLDRSVAPKHHRPDPRKRTLGGRHQIGIPAGFLSESVAGFVGILTHRAGEVADRLLALGDAVEIVHGAQHLTVAQEAQGMARARGALIGGHGHGSLVRWLANASETRHKAACPPH
jgi:hypothetical protein